MPQILPEEKSCRYNSFKKCIGRTCAHFVELEMTNNQTGVKFMEGGCSDSWDVILQMETMAAIRSATAAIESFRNEFVSANEILAPIEMRLRSKLASAIRESKSPAVLSTGDDGEEGGSK